MQCLHTGTYIIDIGWKQKKKKRINRNNENITCVAGEVVDRAIIINNNIIGDERRGGQRLTLWDARNILVVHNGFIVRITL